MPRFSATNTAQMFVDSTKPEKESRRDKLHHKQVMMSKHFPTKKTDTLHAELPPVLVLVAIGTAMAMFLFFALFGQV